MALEGKIKDFGMSDILQLIGMQKKSGLLTLVSPEDSVTISFDTGMVVGAETCHRSQNEILGQALVQGELLEETALNRALALQKETGQKLGHILVREEMVESGDLASIIQLQMQETVYSIFDWTEGTYRFEQVPVTYDRENMKPLSCEKILMEAMRIVDEWPFVQKAIPSTDMVFSQTDPRRKLKLLSGDDVDRAIDSAMNVAGEPSADKPNGALQQDFPLSAMDERVYRLVDGQRNVEQLILAGKRGRFETCKALYSLLSAGLIEEIAGGRDTRTKSGYAGRSRGRKLLRNLLAYAIMFLSVFVVATALGVRGGGALYHVAGDVLGWFEPLRTVHAGQEMNRILFSCRVFYLEEQRYPEALEDLVQKKILKPQHLSDPWGRPYEFAISDRKLRLSSAGKDGQKTTRDDLQKEFYL
jgi:hypothetical protein